VGVRNRYKNSIALVAALSIMAMLSGCTLGKGLTPLPDKERYHFINEVKDDLDYKSSGKVISERYDKGDGVFSPSFFKAEIIGEKSFTILSDKLKNRSDSKCAYLGTNQTRCSLGQVDITIARKDASARKIIFEVTDIHSGRVAK